jgi:hypothetical protein
MEKRKNRQERIKGLCYAVRRALNRPMPQVERWKLILNLGVQIQNEAEDAAARGE